MPYYYQNKISLRHQSQDSVLIGPMVLIVASNYELFGIYRNHLDSLGIRSGYCDKPSRIGEAILLTSPQSLLGELEDDLGSWKELREQLLQNDCHVPIVTMGYHVSPELLQSMMSHGVVHHVNRALTRPHDIGHIFKAIL